MSTNETKVALSAATLLNAMQLPVDVADLVLGKTSVEEIIERGTIMHESTHANELSPTASEIVGTAHESNSEVELALASSIVTRAALNKINFK